MFNQHPQLLGLRNLFGDPAQDAVLIAVGAYALEQMQQGGWKDVCAGVKININGVNTQLANMDMSGVAISGNTAGTQEHKWDWVTCVPDAGVPCDYCNCLHASVWLPFNGCDSINGCGAKCGNTCCNLSASPSLVYRVKLGTLVGIDTLFNTGVASNPVTTFDPSKNALTVTITVANGKLTMNNVMLGARVCIPTGLIEADETASVSCAVNGPVSLTMPLQNIEACSFKTNFSASTLDVSKAKVSNVTATVNGSSLTNWLEGVVDPICSVLGPAALAVCAAGIAVAVPALQTFMDTQMETQALAQVPVNALGQVQDVPLPIPCVFCPNPPKPNPSSPLAPPAGTISIGKIVAGLLESALLPVLTQELGTVWTKGPNWPTFPNVNLTPDGKAHMAIPTPPVISNLHVDPVNSWFDFNTCTVQLAISGVDGEIKGVGLQLMTNEVVDDIKITAAAVAHASSAVEYDPDTGGSLDLAINSIVVTSANQGSATSATTNVLTNLLNALLQSDGGAVNVCLATFAISQAPAFPISLGKITLPPGIPLLPKISCDLDLHPNSKFVMSVPRSGGDPELYVTAVSTGGKSVLQAVEPDSSKALQFQFVQLNTAGVQLTTSVFQLKVGDQMVSSFTITGTGTYFILDSSSSGNTFSFLPPPSSTATGAVSMLGTYLVSHTAGGGDMGGWRKGANNFFWASGPAGTPLRLTKTGVVL